MQPRTSYMQSMRSTTELHPHLTRVFFCFCRFKNTINPVVGNYQDISEIILHESHRTVLGDATQDLIHAKDALYHWATSPVKKSPFCFCRFTNTTNPVVVNYQEKSEIISHENHRTFLGDTGDWTQDLINAKHALYHWATSPLNESLFCFCRFKNTINPVVRNYQDISEIIFLKFAWNTLPFCFCRFSKPFNSKSTAQTCNMFPQICMKRIKLGLEMLGIEPRTSYMQNRRSTTELHPHLMRVFSAFVDIKTL